MRELLIVGEIALAVMVVTAAGFLVRSFLALQSSDKGFAAESVQTFRTALGWKRYTTQEQIVRYYERALSALKAVPEFQDAAFGTAPPLARQHEPPATIQREGQARDLPVPEWRAPRMRVQWTSAELGFTGPQVAKLLYEGTLRIDVGPSNRNLEGAYNSIGVGAHMMMPGDEKVIADRLYEILSKAPRTPLPAAPSATANAGGRWEVHIEYLAGAANHVLTLEQQGNALAGTHEGERLRGEVSGTVSGHEVRMQSAHRVEGTSLGYRFTGTVAGETMSGDLNVGEYGMGRWTARRV